MESSYQLLLTLAGMFLLGLIGTAMGKRTFLPRVTVLLLFGLLIGEGGLDLIPHSFSASFGLIADIALVMVGFLLGSELTASTLRNSTGEVLWISIVAALVTTVITMAGLLLAGLELHVAILMGCIASATAPAAVLDVVSEAGRQGRFSRLLLAIVALDDIWALVLFSTGMAVVAASLDGGGQADFLLHAGREIFGALLLGLLVGVPGAYLTGRVKPGQPVLMEALALVFLCGGLALWLEVSFLIAAMTMGAAVANIAKHHEYPFHAIEDIEQPFLVLFFVLAGASLEFASLQTLGVFGLVYIGCRSLGKIAGAWVGSLPARSDAPTRRWMGYALLPQAGVAIGMALVASHQFPQYQSTLLTLVIASTVVFEIFGPVFTRLALVHGNVAPIVTDPGESS